LVSPLVGNEEASSYNASLSSLSPSPARVHACAQFSYFHPIAPTSSIMQANFSAKTTAEEKVPPKASVHSSLLVKGENFEAGMMLLFLYCSMNM
jgi:hypothetical protein